MLPNDWQKVSSLIFNTECLLNKSTSLKEIIQIHSNRSLEIESLYNNNIISKELYKYLIERGYCDGHLLKYRSKLGYKDLCCTRCIDKLKGSICICRVPKKNVDFYKCNYCGCKGCSDKKK